MNFFRKNKLDGYVILKRKVLVKQSEFKKYNQLIYFVEFQNGSRKNITNKIKDYRFGFVPKSIIEQCLDLKFERLIVFDNSTNEEREIKLL